MQFYIFKVSVVKLCRFGSNDRKTWKLLLVSPHPHFCWRKVNKTKRDSGQTWVTTKRDNSSNESTDYGLINAHLSFSTRFGCSKLWRHQLTIKQSPVTRTYPLEHHVMIKQKERKYIIYPNGKLCAVVTHQHCCGW